MIPVNISIVRNHCKKSILEETYTSAILFFSFEYYCIASEISTNNYQDIFSVFI